MARRLTGPQKAAILLLALGEESAAEVLKNLSQDEIEEVAGYMSRVEEVTPQDVARVTSEFYLVAEKARILPEPPETRVQYLKKVLGKALGEARAQAVVDGMVKASEGSALERLKWHDPGTIAAFIGDEHPQVIAVILANLGDIRLAQAVLAALPMALQQDVYPRLAKLRAVPPEWLEEIEKSLGEEAASGAGPAGSGGPKRVASVLASMPGAAETRWLGQIERRDPAVAERIRGHLFAFDELIKVDSYGMQKVLARTPAEDIVLALKLAGDDVKRHVLANLSPQAAASIEQALEELGPASIAQVEAAQRRMATTAREMEERGELFVLERKKPKPAAKER